MWVLQVFQKKDFAPWQFQELLSPKISSAQLRKLLELPNWRVHAVTSKERYRCPAAEPSRTGPRIPRDSKWTQQTNYGLNSAGKEQDQRIMLFIFHRFHHRQTFFVSISSPYNRLGLKLFKLLDLMICPLPLKPSLADLLSSGPSSCLDCAMCKALSKQPQPAVSWLKLDQLSSFLQRYTTGFGFHHSCIAFWLSKSFTLIWPSKFPLPTVPTSLIGSK